MTPRRLGQLAGWARCADDYHCRCNSAQTTFIALVIPQAQNVSICHDCRAKAARLLGDRGACRVVVVAAEIAAQEWWLLRCDQQQKASCVCCS